MKHIFVGHGGQLRPRWQEAFPDAQGLSSLFELAPAKPGEARMLWFDISNTSAAERMALVNQCISSGLPVIVMSSLPSDEEAYDMLRNGAYGYCHNVAAPSQLMEIAQVVEHGGLWVGAAILKP
jgi:DNA-binding NarL/FixJ family response regulator